MEIKNTTKMSAVRDAVRESHVKIWNDVRVEPLGITIPIYIPRFNISVILGENEGIYGKIKGFTHPVFVRDNDTVAFVLAKIRNTMTSPVGRIYPSRERKFKAMMTRNVPSASSSLSHGKKRRRRIPAVKVNYSGKPLPPYSPCLKLL